MVEVERVAGGGAEVAMEEREGRLLAEELSWAERDLFAGLLTDPVSERPPTITAGSPD